MQPLACIPPGLSELPAVLSDLVSAAVAVSRLPCLAPFLSGPLPLQASFPHFAPCVAAAQSLGILFHFYLCAFQCGGSYCHFFKLGDSPLG